MASRHRTSPEQFLIIVDYMERHGDIARPQKGPQGRITSDRLWEDLKDILNSTGGGGTKSTDKWKKVWADFKTKTKTKALQIRCHKGGTGGGPNLRISLTALEERVLAIIGVAAVDGQHGIGEQGFGSHVEPPALPHQPSISGDAEINLDSEYDSQDIFFIGSPLLPARAQSARPDPIPSPQFASLAVSSAAQPSTSHGLPTASSAGPQLPAASSAGPQQPVASSIGPQPSTSHGLPTTSGAEPQPSTSRRPPRPSTSRRPPRPSTSRRPPRPSTSRRPPWPSTSRELPAASDAGPHVSVADGAVPQPSTSRGLHQTPNAASTPSSVATTPQSRRRRPAARGRRRSQMTPFERACSEFTTIEHKRLCSEEARERLHHERETERLRLHHERETEWLRVEEFRIQTQRSQMELLERLVSLGETLVSRLAPI